MEQTTKTKRGSERTEEVTADESTGRSAETTELLDRTDEILEGIDDLLDEEEPEVEEQDFWAEYDFAHSPCGCG